MYLCVDCKKEFEDPVNRPVISGEFWGAPFTQYDDTCPYCKSNCIFEIKYRCDCCNCSIVEGDDCYKTNDGSVFCENCITKTEA